MGEKDSAREVKRLEKEMLELARNLEFERAAQLRDQLADLRRKVFWRGGRARSRSASWYPDEAGFSLFARAISAARLPRRGSFASSSRMRACQSLIEVESAGTHGYHVGAPPDPRALAAGLARGYDLSDLRARRVRREDFHRFDLIVALDDDHFAALAALAPPSAGHKVRRMMEFARRSRAREVPDPYYGPPEGFRSCPRLGRRRSRGAARLKQLGLQSSERLRGWEDAFALAYGATVVPVCAASRRPRCALFRPS